MDSFSHSSTIVLSDNRKLADSYEKYNTKFVNSELLSSIEDCDCLVAYPSFRKIGDSLFFLPLCSAFLSVVKRKERNIPCYVIGNKEKVTPFKGIIKDFELVNVFDEKEMGKPLIVSDRSSISIKYLYHYSTKIRNYPRFISIKDEQVYKKFFALWKRYILLLELEVGQKIPLEEDSFPPIANYSFKDDLFKVGIVAATNMNEYKNFSIDKYLEIVSYIHLNLKKLDAVYFYFGSIRDAESQLINQVMSSLQIKYKVFRDCLNSMINSFSELSMCIGNDTGITHLCSCTMINKSFIPTIIIYSRSDYTKWSNGCSNVYPVETRFARFLRKYNLSPIRDEIKKNAWGDESKASSVDVSSVINKVMMLLKH